MLRNNDFGGMAFKIVIVLFLINKKIMEFSLFI